MTTTDRIRTVPRSLVGAGLGAARLPVTLAARVVGQTGNEAWAPLVAFDGLQAQTESTVGALLRDETLLERGRLRAAKVDQIRRAAALETLADQERAQADERYAEQRERAEQRRETAAEQAERREQTAEKQAAARKQNAAKRAAKQTQAAAKAEAAVDETLSSVERDERLKVLNTESQALNAQERALDAEETLEVVGDTLEGTKAARRTG